MKWYNALLDPPPQHNELVLVSVVGIYYICSYDAQENIYKLSDQIGKYFDPEMDQIYWAEFTSPEAVN